jgi:hypothetical protein
MLFHRFDSSDATLQTVHRAAKHLTNALRGISERLNAISISRLNGEHHPLPQYSERLGRRTQPPRGAVSELTPLIYKGVMFIFQMNSYKFKLTF